MSVSLALALAIAAGVAAPAASPGPEALVERAAVTGDLARLKQLREQLRSAGDSPYTLAYVDWRLMDLLPKRERKGCAAEAEAVLGRLIESEPEHAEAHALLGSVIGKRITGAISGMRLGGKASRAHDRASELAPDNPRVALQRGVSAFFKPKSFGGGLEAAESELRRAVELFARERTDRPWPNWGRVEAHAWLGRVQAERGDVAGARAEYAKGLAIEPDYRWIRDVLLPELGDSD